VVFLNCDLFNNAKCQAECTSVLTVTVQNVLRLCNDRLCGLLYRVTVKNAFGVVAMLVLVLMNLAESCLGCHITLSVFFLHFILCSNIFCSSWHFGHF